MSEKTFIVRIESISNLSKDVKLFELRPIDNYILPPFDPGSHILIYLENGLIRQYSLCNKPFEKNFYKIAVKLEPNSRGGSFFLHHQIKIGDIIKISEPINRFRLVDAHDYYLLAGGIGITPIISMAWNLSLNGKPFIFDYFVRSLEYAAFKDEIDSSPWSAQAKIYYGFGPDEVRKHLEERFSSYKPDRHIYVCGPEKFMEMVVNIASKKYPNELIHFEYFSRNIPMESESAVSEFRVRCARSGIEVVVPPEESIANVLRKNGIKIDLVCQKGICGSCVTKVLEGRPDHKDLFLTPEEHAANNQIALCCSRSLDPLLVLDI